MARTSFLVALAFGLAICAAAEPDTRAVEGDLNQLTELANNLRIETAMINIINAPIMGHKIPQGLSLIIKRLNEAAQYLQSASGAIAKKDEDTVLVVLKTYVTAQQVTVNFIIGKHGIVTLMAFFEPIRTALVTLEAAVDLYGYQLAEAFPHHTDTVRSEFATLSATIETAIKTYEQSMFQM